MCRISNQSLNIKNMEDKILNEKESLELISKMIQNTQQKLESEQGRPLLIFGYITVIISVFVYVLLKTTNSYYSNLLWFTIPLLGGLFMFILRKKRTKYVKTYIDGIVNIIWSTIGAIVILLSFSSFFISLNYVALMLLLLGIATTLTGLIIKFKPIIFCGIIGTLGCVLPFVFNGCEQVLIFGLFIAIMMIIPGHILNYKGRKANV